MFFVKSLRIPFGALVFWRWILTSILFSGCLRLFHRRHFDSSPCATCVRRSRHVLLRPHPGSVDDGRSDTLGRMAIAVHKGFLRQRARCHPNGEEAPSPERPEVAFIGASNVGKSSLMNALTRTQQLAPATWDRKGVISEL